MGRSVTYHVVGTADNGNLYCAMSREEMAQKEYQAAARGDGALSWYSQTRVGDRLVESGPSRVVSCQVCQGNGCIVCRFSGVCRPGKWYARLWRPWQLNEIAKNSRFAAKA